MRCSYSENDVVVLLKDITGMIEPKSTEERERLIQSGKHYSQMLPLESRPSEKYMEAYEAALKSYSFDTAAAIGAVAEKILLNKGRNVVLVSLARAGIPVGILIKRYIMMKYKINVPHYAISIIRGRGIDKNALKFILKRHRAGDLQFVDGWIGKGAILKELKKDLAEFKEVSPNLAAAADPANETELCGTHEDILIPNSCLNSTVSGLISRTVLNDELIGENDFHGAVYYKELEKYDISYDFINAIESKFSFDRKEQKTEYSGFKGIDEVNGIAKDFGISDINFIKPGIGETTRVLLRRVPWKILIKNDEMENPMISHILRLAEEKNVVVEPYGLVNYRACGIIKKYSDA